MSEVSLQEHGPGDFSGTRLAMPGGASETAFGVQGLGSELTVEGLEFGVEAFRVMVQDLRVQGLAGEAGGMYTCSRRYARICIRMYTYVCTYILTYILKDTR